MSFRPLPFALLFAAPALAADVTVLDRPPVTPASTQFVGNRPPLEPSGLVRLPPGAVQPDGWLKAQLRMQADGFHGHLQEISAFLKKDGNAWLAKDGRGQQGWEEVPYWLKGYLNCGYVLGDETIIQDAQVWIEGAMHNGGGGTTYPLPFGGTATYSRLNSNFIVDTTSSMVQGMPNPLHESIVYENRAGQFRDLL